MRLQVDVYIGCWCFELPIDLGVSEKVMLGFLSVSLVSKRLPFLSEWVYV